MVQYRFLHNHWPLSNLNILKLVFLVWKVVIVAAAFFVLTMVTWLLFVFFTLFVITYVWSNKFLLLLIIIIIIVPNVWLHGAGLTFFWRLQTLTFFIMQKMCAEVDAHNQRITFIRVFVKLSTDSDARPANHNALTKIIHF